MQKRVAKLYSILFLTAFALALALTACSDSNNNNRHEDATNAKLDMKLSLPETEAKTWAATKQILVCLFNEDGNEVPNSRALYTAEGATPYMTDVNYVTEYVDHVKSETNPIRYVTFQYVTDYVGKPVTIVMEYYGESAEDEIATVYNTVDAGLAAGKTTPMTTSDFKPVDPTVAYITCSPEKIVTQVNGSEPLKVTMHEGDSVKDITKEANYTLNPSTLGTINKEEGKFVAGSVAGSGTLTIAYEECDSISVPVTVEEKTETKYTLVADFSQVTWKDTVTGAKIGEEKADVVIDKSTGTATATVKNQSAGSYFVTLYCGESPATTLEKILFDASKATKENVITCDPLEDKSFVKTCDLVLDYSEIKDSFNKDAKNLLIVGETKEGVKLGEFEQIGGYKAVCYGYVFDKSGKVEVNFVVNDGSTVYAETTTPVMFTESQTEPSKLTDKGNFPEYYTLTVNYNGVTDSVMKKSDVEYVKIEGIVANGPTDNEVYLDKQTVDMLGKDLKVTFVTKERSDSMQAEHTFTDGKGLIFNVEDSNLVPATLNVTIDCTALAESGKTYGHTLVGGSVELNNGEDGSIGADNKAVIENVAPGKYSVEITDFDGNTYVSTAEYDVEFSVEKTEAVLHPDNYKASDVTLTFDFTNKEVREMLGYTWTSPYCPLKVELKKGESVIDLIREYPESVNYSYEPLPAEQLQNWEGYTATIYLTADNKIVLKNPVDMKRADAKSNVITHYVKMDDFTTHKLVVKYGDAGRVPSIRIKDNEKTGMPGITRIEFENPETGLMQTGNITTQTDKLFVADSGTVEQVLAGDYRVVITQGTYGKVGYKQYALSLAFKLAENGDLVADVEDENISTALYVYDIYYTIPASEGFKATDLKDVILVDSSDNTCPCDYFAVVEESTTGHQIHCCWQQLPMMTDPNIEAVYNGGVKHYIADGLVKGIKEYSQTLQDTDADSLTADWAIVHIDYNNTKDLTRIDTDRVKNVGVVVEDDTGDEVAVVGGAEEKGMYWVAFEADSDYRFITLNLYDAEDIDEANTYVFETDDTYAAAVRKWTVVDTDVGEVYGVRFDMSDYTTEQWSCTHMTVTFTLLDGSEYTYGVESPLKAEEGIVTVTGTLYQGMGLTLTVQVGQWDDSENKFISIAKLTNTSVDLFKESNEEENTIDIGSEDWKRVE